MSQQPFTPAALRGAVDLSGLSRRAGAARPGSTGGPAGPPPVAGPPAAGPAAEASDMTQPDGVPGTTGSLVQATDATFESIINASMRTPMVMVLWTPQIPETVAHLRELAATARAQEGRFQVVGVDITDNPGILQALTPILQQAFEQVSALPVVVGLLSGQPMPFYLGVQAMPQVEQLIDQFIQAAVTNGITGRVDVSGEPADGGPESAGRSADGAEAEDEGGEPELPPLHQQAYEAIEAGDFPGAVAAYEQALEQDPADDLARLGLGQVKLLERTSRLDLTAVRQAAADSPTDVQAQIDAADVDLVGGHVEDAFVRLIDTVKVTAGDDRDRARTHLLELFEVIGAQDERVVKGRRALMSALF